MALSPEELDEKRDYERLFGEAGWHRLEKIWTARAAALREQALDRVRSMDDVWRTRGNVEILDELIRARHDVLAQFDRQDVDDTSEPGYGE